jgi:hypothetical protein
MTIITIAVGLANAPQARRVRIHCTSPICYVFDSYLPTFHLG